jgi:hypothetical protein
VDRELGPGQDLKQERPVALDVLRPELALAVRSKRFLREVRIVAGFAIP